MFVSKYSEEQKKKWLEEFKKNNKPAQTYAKEIGVPPSTFRLWISQEISEEYEGKFGGIAIEEDISKVEDERKQIKYCGSKIEIILKEGYDKEFLRDIVEVLINDR